MKKIIKSIALILVAATMISFAACSKDSDNNASGGTVPTGGKQLARITQIMIEERLDNGDWMTEDYEEITTELVWSANRLTGVKYSHEEGVKEEIISYNNEGHITQITDPEGRIYTPTYNTDGRIVKTTRTSTSSNYEKYYTYTYDDAGKLIKIYRTYSDDNSWRKTTFTWENGNIVRKVVEYNDEENSRTYTYSYDSKVNVYSCVPSDYFLATASAEANCLSRNNVTEEGDIYTYSGNYPIKVESTYESGTERETSTQYFEYTDGTGRR